MVPSTIPPTTPMTISCKVMSMPSHRAGRAGMISLKSMSIYLPPTEIRPGTATFFSTMRISSISPMFRVK